MTLAFSTHINHAPTFFVEKIRLGLLDKNLTTVEESNKYFPSDPDIYRMQMTMAGETPKLHTIREDKSDRWKAGNDIHMVVNNRTPKRFQFAPVVKCVSTQYFGIQHSISNPGIVRIFIDGDIFYEGPEWNIYHRPMTMLAVQDGFAGVREFFEYFKKDFRGKIIHWTDLKY